MQLDLLGQAIASKPETTATASTQDGFSGELPLEVPVLGTKSEEGDLQDADVDMTEPTDSDTKAPSAFRTISEVANFLNVPQHVLRFWETRFSQIKPLKMRGGRRYYRPEDVDTLSTIHSLLYKEGYTINGAKKAIVQIKRTASAAPVLESKDTAQEIKKPVASAVGAAPALTEKQVNQLAVVRQELLSMRDMLRAYVNTK